MWTRFMDMHSGGGCKEPPYALIFIEADEATAKLIFYNRFGHNPERVTCTCCGNDYSICSKSDLNQLTGFDRGCDFDRETDLYVERPRNESEWGEYVTLDAFKIQPDNLFIYEADIKPEERTGVVPEQGYIWKD